jgi:hypothetical protein
MSVYLAAARLGIRAIALIGILPGAIVAAAYLLVLWGQLYHEWDARTAAVFGMAAWGVLGVMELWHEYVRLSQARVDGQRLPLTPRAVLFIWALLLLAFAGWRADTHPWMAAFLALVALYSLGRAFGLLNFGTARPPAVSRRSGVARAAPGAQPRESQRPRTRRTTASAERRAAH